MHANLNIQEPKNSLVLLRRESHSPPLTLSFKYTSQSSKREQILSPFDNHMACYVHLCEQRSQSSQSGKERLHVLSCHVCGVIPLFSPGTFFLFMLCH